MYFQDPREVQNWSMQRRLGALIEYMSGNKWKEKWQHGTPGEKEACGNAGQGNWVGRGHGSTEGEDQGWRLGSKGSCGLDRVFPSLLIFMGSYRYILCRVISCIDLYFKRTLCLQSDKSFKRPSERESL